jgi:hypothetical protein
MMACIADDADLDPPTVVIHRAYLALHVSDEAERHSGQDARELFEDAQRIARSVSWACDLAAGAP